MDSGSNFVSVFKINGRPLLPPAMTPRRRKEMHEYKMKALAVEQRLKDKKKGQRKYPGILVHNDEDGNKENKKIESIYAGNTDDSIFDGRYLTKSVLSERESFKEIPQFLQKSIEKNSTIVCDLPNYGDCQEEAYSVAPTESTDLHPYMNSSLEDEMCSSEANCGAECGSSPKYAEDSTDCDTVEYNCNSEENMERSFIKNAPICESTDLNVRSFSSEIANIIDTTTVVCHLDSQLTHDVIAAETNDLASPCTCSIFNEGEVEANAKDIKNDEAGCNYSSFPSSPSPNESILANESNVDNGVTGISNKTYALSDCFRLQSPPVRLIRTASFTLETPSPLLIANIEQFTIDAPGDTNCPSIVAESNIVYNQANNCADMITECISSENRKSLHLSSSKNEIDKYKSKGTKASVVKKTREASVEHSKREPIKGSIARVTVFDRLAADAAKKVEERRKLNKKSNAEVFKIPKKVAKAASKRMRSSVSASNLRISLSGAHRSRSDTLASKRSNSEVNVSSVHVKSVTSTFKKQNMLAQVVSKPLLRKPGVMNARTSMSNNVGPVVNIPEDMKTPLYVEKDLWLSDSSDKCALAKPTTHDIFTAIPSSSNDVHKIEATHTKRVIYSVQTSPISPPLPPESNELAVTGRGCADNEITALQGGGRQRRRWSVGWSGWVSSTVEQQPESDSQESDIEVCISDGPLKPDCEELEVSAAELEPNLHDVCIHTSVGSITVPLHEVQKSQVSHENNDETELLSPDTVKSQEKITNLETLFLENVISNSPLSNSCGMNDDSVQRFSDDKMRESLVNTPKEASCIITHKVTPMSERYREGSVLLTNSDNLSSDNSVSCSEIVVQPVKILPSLEKTLNLMPDSPVGTLGIKETALKLLGCLVEEQDKAMAKLLDDQRQQAEKMKEQFKVQQKCLVERVANLVTSLSTPQSRKSKIPHQKHGEENIPAPEENVIILKTPPIWDQHLSVPRPITPLTVSRIPIGSGNHISPPCLSQPELSPQLRLDDILVAKSSKDIVNELESQLIKFSQKEDLPLVENSCCQMCLSVQSNCRCSQEESNCSSTIREEITTLSVGSLDNVTVTASGGGVCDTDKCSTIKDKIVCSSSPFQDQNDSNLIHSSVKCEKNVSLSLSSVKTDSALQDGVLDLSEILDMETGRKGGNTRGQNSPCSIDKSKGNFEGMHSSPILPTAHSVKTVDPNPAVSPKENLSLYRQIYEQDLQRLKSFESNAKKESRYIDGLSDNDAGSSMEDNLKSPEKWTVTPDKVPSPQRKTDESERKEVHFDMLPDLRSDILQAYLGSQTPSTGPVFLQTPVPSVACPYQVRPTSSTPEELCTNSTVPRLPPKEVDCLKDGDHPASLNPAIQENLEYQESLDLSPNELHLSIRSSSSSSLSLPLEPCQTFSESHPSATDSHNSDHYTTASSKCFSEDSSRLDKSMLSKFGKLSALIRGYLTRRLLKTEKVRRIKITIRDLMVTALKVHSEVSQEDEVNANDVRLHGQILAELNATCEEFHRVFFEMTKSEQMAIISADRQRLLSSSGSIVVVDAVEVITPRPALLSAVTLKTLQRRFSMYSPKNGVKEAEKKCDNRQPTKKKMSSVGVGARQTMVTNAKGRERASVRSTSKAFSISDDATLNPSSRNMKTSNVVLTRRGHMQSKASKWKRRSASAGEINRKPWR